MHSWSIFRMEKFVDDNFDKAKWRGSNSQSSLNSNKVVEFLEFLEFLDETLENTFISGFKYLTYNVEHQNFIFFKQS